MTSLNERVQAQRAYQEGKITREEYVAILQGRLSVGRALSSAEQRAGHAPFVRMEQARQGPTPATPNISTDDPFDFRPDQAIGPGNAGAGGGGDQRGRGAGPAQMATRTPAASWNTVRGMAAEDIPPSASAYVGPGARDPATVFGPGSGVNAQTTVRGMAAEDIPPSASAYVGPGGRDPAAVFATEGDGGLPPPGATGGATNAGGIDPFTGAVQDIAGFLRHLSESESGRRRLFNENLTTSPAYLGAPSHVQRYLQSRFNPLEAQYLAQGITSPGEGAGGNFNQFLGQTPNTLGGQGWRDLYGNIQQMFGGVGSAGDVAGLGGPQAAGYEILRNRGADIFGQAIQANLNPALAGAANRVLGQRFAGYGAAVQGAPSNQADFVRQQYPEWASILGG